MTLQDRINELFRDRPDVKAAHLARSLNIARASVSAWMTGKSKNISGKNAFAVAKYFNVNPQWLQLGTGNKNNIKNNANYVENSLQKNRVPLFNLTEKKENNNIVNDYTMNKYQEFVETTIETTNKTYALRVIGDSMTPLFPEGAIIIIEPENDAKTGDYIIAELDSALIFKQLQIDGNDFYLKPLNDRYPIKPIGDAKIIGIVKEMILRFK